MTIDNAKTFLQKYVSDTYLLLHSEMVARAMEAVAKYLGEDTTLFYITGLIHDWDFEKWPSEHPGHYKQLRSELGVESELIEAIKGHGDLSYPRTTTLSKALLACDELSGLLYAYQRMVGNYHDMKVSSIRKKIYKEPKFAAKVDREYVIRGIEELGIPEETFFALLKNTFAEKYD